VSVIQRAGWLCNSAGDAKKVLELVRQAEESLGQAREALEDLIGASDMLEQAGERPKVLSSSKGER